jgi:hypothetical protein
MVFSSEDDGVTDYCKFQQITNTKQITMTEIQNFKPVLVIEV